MPSAEMCSRIDLAADSKGSLLYRPQQEGGSKSLARSLNIWPSRLANNLPFSHLTAVQISLELQLYCSAWNSALNDVQTASFHFGSLSLILMYHSIKSDACTISSGILGGITDLLTVGIYQGGHTFMRRSSIRAVLLLTRCLSGVT